MPKEFVILPIGVNLVSVALSKKLASEYCDLLLCSTFVGRFQNPPN